MITNEEDEKISVNFGIYKRFFLTYYGWAWVFLSNLAMVVFTSVTVSSDYITGKWSNEDNK